MQYYILCLRTSPVLAGAGTERTGQRREKTGPNTAARAFGEVRRNPRQPLLIRHIVPILFSIPHRPTKLLLEPAVCKSLKIKEVWSRALASLLITERVICGNRAGKRTAQGATLARPKAFSLGEQAKKYQPIRVGTLSSGGGVLPEGKRTGSSDPRS